MHFGNNIFPSSTTMDCPFGARSATCRTARFSVTLILSPRNMASMRSRRPDSSASFQQEREGLVGDSVLGIVEINTDGVNRHALPARGVIRK